MAMKMTVIFNQPLDAEYVIRARLAAASLAKCNRMFFNDDKSELYLSGEALSIERIHEALKEQKLSVKQVLSTLNEEENEAADDVIEDGVKKERVRPIGR
jgi:hypothetical protein